MVRQDLAPTDFQLDASMPLEELAQYHFSPSRPLRSLREFPPDYWLMTPARWATNISSFGIGFELRMG